MTTDSYIPTTLTGRPAPNGKPKAQRGRPKVEREPPDNLLKAQRMKEVAKCLKAANRALAELPTTNPVWSATLDKLRKANDREAAAAMITAADLLEADL